MGKSSITPPPSRNYGQEMSSALNAQGGIQNQLLSLQGQYVPQYQQMQQQGLTGQMGTIGNLYNTAIPQSAGMQQQMLSAQSPVYNALGQSANQIYGNSLGSATNNLYNGIQQTAQSQLDAGTNLTASQTQQAQQAARAAMQARGLSGNQAALGEMLNTYNMGQQRQQTALANASSAYNLGVAQQGNAMSQYGTPMMNQMNAVSANGLMSQASTGYGALNQGMLFQPESQYNASLISANNQNQMQAQLGNAQANSGMMGGLLGMAGTIGGAFLGNPALGSLLGGTAGKLGGDLMTGTGAYSMPSNPFNYDFNTPQISQSGGLGTTGFGGSSINYNVGNYGAYQPSPLQSSFR